ncbi:MAG: hypothetical protein ACR2MG_09675 [Pyrinomonadaceae bacterium]
MKKLLSLSLTLLLLQSAFCFILSPIKISAQTQELLTNQKIVEMVKTGLSNEIIVAKIKSSKNSFDTSTTAIRELKKAGVSDSIILEMVQKAAGIEVTTTNTGNSGGTPVSTTIPDGTEIKIVTTEDISGQKVVEGDPLIFKIAEDVKINGKTVIAKDTLVKGTVSAAKKKGFMGKGGELSIRIESTQTVDDQKMKLRAAKSGKGGDNMGSTVALTVLFGPLGLLRKGKEAKIKAGTILTAYTDEAKNVMARN